MSAKPPTILQILPSLRSGGVERGTIEIAQAISKTGWKALVASSGGAMVPQVSYVGGSHITLPVGSKNPLQLWKNVALLENTIKEHGIDLIHARSRAPAWSAYYAAKRCGIPFMTTFHGVYGLSPSIKKYYNEIMVKGERVIAISNFIVEHLKHAYHVDPFKIRLIHRGVDVTVFSPAKVAPQRMAALVKEWRLPEDKKVILFPGRFSRWKGQANVLKALAKQEVRDFYCVLMGDDVGHPQYRKELEALAVSLGLEGSIKMVGSTPYMPEAYMLSDVVLAPSIEPEAFGRVPVEAQAMGKPVISTNHGGALETVLQGETGWLVAPGDIDALSDAIRTAMSLTPEQKDAMAHTALAHVNENFTTQRMAEKTLNTYWELIKDRFGG